MSETQSNAEKSPLWRVVELIGSMKLAVFLLSILLVLTFLGTVEQEELGLYGAQTKYFDSYYLFHHFGKGKDLPIFGTEGIPFPLPGAYLVSAILFFNLLAGGVLLMRRGWSRVGVLISHLGILFLLIGGVVGHHSSERGYITLYPGETSTAVVDYVEPQIEVIELEGDQPTKIHVVGSQHLKGLTPQAELKLVMEKLPFDLEIRSYYEHCAPVSVHEHALPPDSKVPTAEGYYFVGLPMPKMVEAKRPGCWARLVSKDGKVIGTPFMIWERSGSPAPPKTVEWEGRKYFVDLVRQLRPLPFEVRLDRFEANFYPGTRKPKSFESWVTRLDETGEHAVHIEMNEPMRAGGLTFYQADWGPKDGSSTRLYSKLEVVKNPADQWPTIATWVIAFGLFIHFGMMLIGFLNRTLSKPKPEAKAVKSTAKESAQ